MSPARLLKRLTFVLLVLLAITACAVQEEYLAETSGENETIMRVWVSPEYRVGKHYVYVKLSK